LNIVCMAILKSLLNKFEAIFLAKLPSNNEKHKSQSERTQPTSEQRE